MNLRIAVDSDMLRNLAAYYNLTNDGNFVKYQTVNNNHINSNFDDYFFLFSYIKSRQLEILVGPAVYNEIKHLDSITGFVKKYCNLTNPDPEKVARLANAYCSPYKENGKMVYQPMEKIYVAAIKKYVPSNDCYIMAQATVDECYLLTYNLKDFIFDDRLGDSNNHRRIEGIRTINTKFKYKRTINEHVYFIPEPMSFSKLIRQLQKKQLTTLSYNPNNSSNNDNFEL